MNPRDDSQKCKHFWESRARQKGKSEQELTHPDIWQRWLEIEMIKKFLTRCDRVLDVGCGNGYTTIKIAPLVSEVLGMDSSAAMIKRAKASKSTGIHTPITPSMSFPQFKVYDVLALNPSIAGLFDVVISERCLINLPSWDDQKRAIRNIAGVLKNGGRFLLIEGSREGRQRLNELRQSVGLESMPVVSHNVDFKKTALLADG